MARVLCVGHAVQDFVFALQELPRRAEKYRATSFESVGGGPAATAAVAIARLGGSALLAVRLGADSTADLIVAELEGYGVDCRHVRRMPGCRSSLSSVVVDQTGERMIVNYLDPLMPSDAEWLPEPTALAADCVLADVRWPEGALRALGQARAAGLSAVLDADRPVPRDAALLQAATHVAFSAEGLAEYSGEQDPVRALKGVAATLDAWCCVTVGEQGVHASSRGRLRHFPAIKVPTVDTLGAGDVWHGAFALALAEGRGEEDAVRFAIVAAALKVQRFGGRAGAPTRDEVQRLIEEQDA